MSSHVEQKKKTKKATLTEVLRTAVELESALKALAESMGDFDSKEGMRMTGEDDANLRTLIYSSESFRLFGRDLLEIMGKHYPQAKRWANDLFFEDCHD